jgi:glucose/arabinose dehydrogenase
MKRNLLLIIFLLGIIRSYGQVNYSVTTTVSGLPYPVAFTFTPDGRYLVTLKAGTIRTYNASGTLLGTFYNLSDSTYDDFERGLLGIEIDPDFTNNHYVYAYYVHRCCVSTGQTGSQYLRIVRFTEANNVGTNPTIILNIQVSNAIPGNHVGGNLRFRPSEPNNIYVSIGELNTGSNAQTLTNPFGKILRIVKDGTIPTDNPFYDDGNPSTGNDDRIWSYGHRNPFDLCFSPVSDSLYISENGSTASAMGDDEVNLGVKGKNYGWPTCEGYDTYGNNNPCNNSSFTAPITVMPPISNSLPAVTGIIYYSGSVMPEFDNHLLVADNDIGNIWDVTLQGPSYATVTTNVILMDVVTPGGLTTLKQGADGCVYAMKGGYNASGTISKICHSGVGIAESTAELSIGAYPNPFNETATISYTIEKPAFVSIALYDITGRKIADLSNESTAAGKHTLTVDASAFGAGTYFCTVKANDVQRTIKLVIIK